MKPISWVLLSWLSLAISAQAASFDCGKASTKSEKIICGDDELSKLDETLSNLYRQVIERNIDRQEIVKEQKAWLKDERNVCQDASCMKRAYEARTREVAELLKRPAYVHSSYFIDTPVRSIDEMMNDCFADATCAAQAEVLIPAYSKKSNISERDIRDTLKSCIANQRAMNICAGYEQFVIKSEMLFALQEATHDAPAACKTAIEKQQTLWERNAWDKCSKKADEEFGWGSAWGGVVMSCNSEALKERIRRLERVGSCEPCSKCLGLP